MMNTPPPSSLGQLYTQLTSPPPSPPTPGPSPIPIRYHLRHLHSLSIHDLRHLRTQQARLHDRTIPDYDRKVAYTIAHDQAQESLSDLRRCLRVCEKQAIGRREKGRDGALWGYVAFMPLVFIVFRFQFCLRWAWRRRRWSRKSGK